MSNQPPGPARTALEKMIEASTELRADSASALVQLGRTLADQMDRAGDEPSTRLSAAYLSILVNLRRMVTPSTSAHKSAGRLAAIKNGAKR